MVKRKLLLLYLFICPFLLQAQNLDRKISISVTGATFTEILSIISQKGEIHFSYSPSILPQKKITISFQNKPVREILNELLNPEGIEYRLVENQVILKASQAKDPSEPERKREVKRYTLSGFLRDKETGEPLIGASVYDAENFTGTTTNSYGFYSLTLAEGVYKISVSYVGYSRKEKVITLDAPVKYSCELDPVHLEIGEVEVFSAPGPGDDHGFRLTSSQLAAMPGFAGEQDVIRALQVIPGIQNYGDGSALFYVRGGNSDQNLIMIDDAPIFNPSHMFGFFTVIAPDAIQEADVYKGDFPAHYGGRLSSVVDIRARNGNLKQFGFSGNIGPYASALSAEGPVVRDKGSFFISGRISSINWLKFLNTTSTDFKVNFYDLNAKLNYRINANNRLFATFYYGNDSFDRTTGSSIITYGISWSNLAGILRWNHTFNPRLFSNTTAYYSRYAYFLYTSVEQKQYWTSVMENLALKNDLTWYLSPRNTAKAGFEVALHHSNPGNVNFKFSDSQDGLMEIPEYRALEYVLYASDDLTLWKKIDLSLGIRLPLWQNIGPFSVFYFDVNHQVIDTITVKKNETYSWYLRPEPRISLRYHPNDVSSFRISYSRNTQFMQVLSTSVSPFTSLEVWTFSGPNVKPRTADHVCLGYTGLFRKKMFTFTADLFYKWISNNIDYADHADMFYNPLLEGELRPGDSWSYGAELMLKKQKGRLTGWIAYTWSRAFIQTPEVNNGEAYPAFYDRPHVVCINLAWSSGRWSFSGNWLLMSGAAITTPVGFYYLNGYSVPLYGERNNDRLPVYHRLDLSAAYALNKPGNRFRHSLILTLYNAYGRNNPFTIGFNRFASGDNFVVPADLSGGYQLVPVSVSVAGIIPSINYQFRF